MASTTPYAMLTGTWKFWVAPEGTAKPDLGAAVSGTWVALGNTEGDQTFQYEGTLTELMDNHSTAPKKFIRPSEGFTVTAALSQLTMEDKAYIASMAQSAIATATATGYNVKQLPNKRGFNPTKYALLARGGALEASNTMSPYGAWPAQLYIPQGVFDGEPQETYSKDGSPTLQFVFRATEDSTQSAGNEFGFLEAAYETA